MGVVVERVLLGQVLLKFAKKAAIVRSDLSAVVHTPEGYLWLGSDELTTIDRLLPIAPNEYGDHQQYEVGDYVNLPDNRSEIDIEGMDFEDGYLWLVGSHSTRRKGVKGQDAKKNIRRLLDVSTDANRYVLARIPLVEGVPVKQDKATGRSAACLEKGIGRSALTDVLMDDEHIGPFLKMGLPSKDNGLDIEAIALNQNRIFLGLRGPVLRGIAIILEIELKEAKAGRLKLKKLENGKYYRKHFVDLNGLGVRDLCFRGEELVILAGPTMTMNGYSQFFSLRNLLNHQDDSLTTQDSGDLERLFALAPDATENAEGITLFSAVSKEPVRAQQRKDDLAKLLVVYDSPDLSRLSGKQAIFADVFQL